MGVTGFVKLLEKEDPKLLHAVKDLSDYSGQRFAIDAAGMLHRYKHAFFQEDDPYGYLQQIISQYNQLKKHGIRVIYVFDGARPTCKTGEVLRRAAQKKNNYKLLDHKKAEYEEAVKAFENAKELVSLQPSSSNIGPDDGGDVLETLLPAINAIEQMHVAKKSVEEIEIKLGAAVKRSATITGADIQLAQTMFDFYGIANVTATGEGEKGCAWMTLVGWADVAVSDDADTLIYGAKRWMRHLMSGKFAATEIMYDEVMSSLSLKSHEELIDLAISCGCDYAKIPNVASGKALSLIREYGCIENYPARLPKPKNEKKRTRMEKKVGGEKDEFLKPPRKKRKCLIPTIVVALPSSSEKDAGSTPTLTFFDTQTYHDGLNRQQQVVMAVTANREDSERSSIMTDDLKREISEARQEFSLAIDKVYINMSKFQTSVL